MYDKLSVDLFVELCSYMRVIDLSHLAQCNKKSKELCGNERIWKLILNRDFCVKEIKTAHKVFMFGYLKYNKDCSCFELYRGLYRSMISSMRENLEECFLKYIKYELLAEDIFKLIKNQDKTMGKISQFIKQFLTDIDDINKNRFSFDASVVENLYNNKQIYIIGDNVRVPAVVVSNDKILCKYGNLSELSVCEQNFFEETTLKYEYNDIIDKPYYININPKYINFMLQFK